VRTRESGTRRTAATSHASPVNRARAPAHAQFCSGRVGISKEPAEPPSDDRWLSLHMAGQLVTRFWLTVRLATQTVGILSPGSLSGRVGLSSCATEQLGNWNGNPGQAV
jgi:hypothetical protein